MRVIVTRPEGQADELAERLRSLGHEVVLCPTHERRPAQPPLGDAVVLASGSAARAFGALGVDIPAVSIGPQTTAAATAAGVRVVAEAATHDVDGLINALARLEP